MARLLAMVDLPSLGIALVIRIVFSSAWFGMKISDERKLRKLRRRYSVRPLLAAGAGRSPCDCRPHWESGQRLARKMIEHFRRGSNPIIRTVEDDEDDHPEDEPADQPDEQMLERAGRKTATGGVATCETTKRSGAAFFTGPRPCALPTMRSNSLCVLATSFCNFVYSASLALASLTSLPNLRCST